MKETVNMSNLDQTLNPAKAAVPGISEDVA
jgi:hypothetical protein